MLQFFGRKFIIYRRRRYLNCQLSTVNYQLVKLDLENKKHLSDDRCFFISLNYFRFFLALRTAMIRFISLNTIM